MDICNQRILQQDAEFENLRFLLHRHRGDEELKVNQSNFESEKAREELISPKSEIQYAGRRGQRISKTSGSDRFTGMRTGLTVRSALKRISSQNTN